ncbi:glutathione transferase GstA [bacterium]|nr:MAG: glutathione transferase GstA [bacterium]
MKLYSSPLACSIAVQMILLELELDHTIEFVDIYLQPHILLKDKSVYTNINPKGAVPALILGSGELLTEVGVILQYICDLKPETDLLPKIGTMERYRVMEWLSFIGSDVHKTIGPLFNPHMPEVAKDIHKQNLHRRLTYIDQCLAKTPYLTGDTFTIADAYLFVMIGWKPYFKFDISPYTNIKRFHQSILERPSFNQVIKDITPIIEQVNLPSFQ